MYYAANYDDKLNELWRIKDTTLGTGIAVVNNISPFDLYPNPNNGNFIKKLSSLNITDNAILKVYDAIGKLVHSQSITQAATILQLSHLPKGVYEAVLQQGGSIARQRLVVQ